MNSSLRLILQIVVVAICFAWHNEARAQGVSMNDFKEKLRPYFAEEMITDIEKQLVVQGDYKIWGWDIGDFSADGYADVAFALKAAANKTRTVTVYLFADIDGYLTRVGMFDKRFVELPIEVGVLFEDSLCRIIQKLSADRWQTQSVRFLNGSLCEVDTSSTEQEEFFQKEYYRNYISLYGRDILKKRNAKAKEKPAVDVEFMAIPAYRRGARVYQGYKSTAFAGSIRFVPKGAYWWSGAEDASLAVRAAYNDEYLYVSVTATDDTVITERMPDGVADKIEVWLDCANTDDRYFSDEKQSSLRTVADSGLYAFTFSLGNFADRKPYFNISCTDNLTEQQKAGLEDVRVVAAPQKNGFTLKARIPLKILGIENRLSDSENPSVIGATVVFKDVDNEFRPDEETWIATSNIQEANPSTLGELLFVPAGKMYGQSKNIYAEKIAQELQKSGF